MNGALAEAAGRMLWLGTHRPNWVSREDMPGLFISRRTLAELKTWPEVRCEAIAIDSGGFTELGKYGGWSTEWDSRGYRNDLAAYCEFIERAVAWAGDRLRWVAPMDWMCEPDRLNATGLDVDTHLRYTVANYVGLINLLPADIAGRVVPVVQGWEIDDYMRCVAYYEQEGIDLEDVPLVGIGSVCRRASRETVRDGIEIVSELAHGMNVHAFGAHREVVVGALRRGALDWTWNGAGWAPRGLVSCDTLAWSATARRQRLVLDGCEHGCCNNCSRWALRWRDQFMGEIGRAHAAAMGHGFTEQMSLFAGTAA